MGRFFCCWLVLMLGCGSPVWANEHSQFELPPAQLSAQEESEVDAMVLPVPQAWVGDFDGMRERRMVRILVPYSKTFYLIDRGRQDGVAYAFGKAFEGWLNKTQPFADKTQRWQVMFLPTARNELLPKLLAGDGDVVADIFRNRVVKRNKGAEVWGWGTAYGSKQAGQAPAKVEGVKK